MSFDWKEFIILSDNIVKMDPSNEANLRTGISRAYYGVFCIARNRKGLKNDKSGKVHRNVINSYKTSNDKNEKYIGKILDDLRRQRNDADYDEDKEIGIDLTERVLLKTKEILKKLENN